MKCFFRFSRFLFIRLLLTITIWNFNAAVVFAQGKKAKESPAPSSPKDKKATDKKTTDKKAATVVEEPKPVILNDSLIENILRAEPEKFANLLDSASKYHIQILYTQINRDKKNKPSFVSRGYRLNYRDYFYPASSVKLSIALLAMELVNAMRQKTKDEELTRNARMEVDSLLPWQHPVTKDLTSPDSAASITHFTRKILLTSDNDGYNRLYELLGVEHINKQLAAKGFNHFKISSRLSAGTSPEQNKTTNRVYLYGKNGRTLYRQPMTTATTTLETILVADSVINIKQGIGFMQDDKVVSQPKDFTTSNYMALETLQEILKTVLFPDAVPAKQRFNFPPEDYEFLYRYLSMLPRESRYPKYDTSYYDSYVKFLMFGDKKDSMPSNVRVFNKVGDAYGYLIDNAYIVDFEKGVEFMLAAVIYVNADEIFNDDKYEYDQIGLPFMGNLGRAIYNYELTRERANKPNLNSLQALVGTDPSLPEPAAPKPKEPTKSAATTTSSSAPTPPAKVGAASTTTATSTANAAPIPNAKTPATDANKQAKPDPTKTKPTTPAPAPPAKKQGS